MPWPALGLVLMRTMVAMMSDNFLVDIEYDPVYNTYMACYSNGVVIQLGATTYHDAVLEADTIEPYEYEGA